MGPHQLKKMEKLGYFLFALCFIAWGGSWSFMVFFNSSAPEAEGWETIAGFFKGFIWGGFWAIVPAIYSLYMLRKFELTSSVFNSIFILSSLWFIFVIFLYLI